MPAIGITDDYNMYGSLQASTYCEKSGVQPIIGSTIKVVMTAGDNEEEIEGDLLLLAKSEEGVENLFWLSSQSYLGEQNVDHPRLSLAEISSRSSGIICLTGGESGILHRAIVKDKSGSIAYSVAAQLLKIFQDRLYVELQRCNENWELLCEDRLIEIAYKYNIQLVATNDVFFKSPEDHESHDALMCIADGKYIEDDNRRRISPEHYFKTTDQMLAIFSDIPEATRNTVLIAKRCHAAVCQREPILPQFPLPDGRTAAEELRVRCNTGLENRFNNVVLPWISREKPETDIVELRKKYQERLDFELSVIEGMDFPGYFLIVSDFMVWAVEERIPVGVRGSGGTSIVAWCMFITHIDPMRFDLVFERFLNPERISMPDFDVDFCQRRRADVIRYVQSKYGVDKVAQIITYGTMQAKVAVRDLGRVLQLPYGLVDRIAKLIPEGETLKGALQKEPELNRLLKSEPQARKIFELGARIEGLYRQVGVHAAGVVIGDRPLPSLLPLYKDASSDMPVTQYSYKDAEKVGMVKFDFLGLKTLTVISETEKLVLDALGEQIDVASEPFENTAVYDLLSNADTLGVFQLESPGMRDLLSKLKPERLEDLIALISLYRPGPMESIPTYIARKNGKEEVVYDHPLTEPVLAETYGIITYQEQVMQLARDLANYSLGEADLLRRAMGKKIKEEMDLHQDRFVSGAVKLGMDADIASVIFEKCAKFASYGFNKGHAAAYAQVAFKTAWLKTYFRREFSVANMNLDIASPDRLTLYWNDLKLQNILLGPLCINHSHAEFSIQDDLNGQKIVRYAFSAIKGVGSAVGAYLVSERLKNGLYKDIFDFFERVDISYLNKKTLEQLIKAGAFDVLEPNRKMLLYNLSTLISYSTSISSNRKSGQSLLFSGEETQLRPIITKVDGYTVAEQLDEEQKAVGFYLTGHPLDQFDEMLRAMKICSLQNASKYKAQRVAAVIQSVSTKYNAKGKKFAFVSVSDKYSSFEVLLFSDAFDSYEEHLNNGNIIVIEPRDRVEIGASRIVARRIVPLLALQAGGELNISIRLSRDISMPHFLNAIKSARNGHSKIRVEVPMQTESVAEIELGERYDVSPELISVLSGINGVDDIKFH